MENPNIIIDITGGVVQALIHNIHGLKITLIDHDIHDTDFGEDIRVLNFPMPDGVAPDPAYVNKEFEGTQISSKELLSILDEKILYGEEAIDFFEGATQEQVEGITEDQTFLNREIGGYWYDDHEMVYIAFDNYSGNLTVEEFDHEKEALKYAAGIMAVTKGGMEI